MKSSRVCDFPIVSVRLLLLAFPTSDSLASHMDDLRRVEAESCVVGEEVDYRWLSECATEIGSNGRSRMVSELGKKGVGSDRRRVEYVQKCRFMSV